MGEYLAPTLDDPEGSVDLLTSHGERLRSSILSLSYFDPVRGHRETIALVRDVGGLLLPPNRVIYPDAFESTHPEYTVNCDVIYTYRRSGIEQDVVIRELLPPPEAFGMNSDLARLEVVTEFFEAPEPLKNERLLATLEDADLRARVAEPDWKDESLDFGAAVIGAGRAFRLSDEPVPAMTGAGSLAVGKSWIVQEDRRLLVEAVDFLEILPLLLELPGDPQAAARLPLPERFRSLGKAPTRAERLAAVRGLPSREAMHKKVNAAVPKRQPRRVGPETQRLLLADARMTRRPGVVLDYIVMAVNTTNFTFRGNETYLISDTIHLHGTTTLEGGAVLKYAKYLWEPPVPQITVLGWGPHASQLDPGRHRNHPELHRSVQFGLW